MSVFSKAWFPYRCICRICRTKTIHRTEITLWKPPVKCSIQKKRQIQLVVRDRMNSICPMIFFSYDRHFFVRTTLTFEVICHLLLNQCNRQHEIYLLIILRGLSLRLRQQGFVPNLLQKSSNKFFNRHGLIVMKYGATLREMRLAIQA